ncbi:MAG TPA: ribonuclease R [Blastocatellia bacterium]|nr:ribonuclease R [Blastocatellia bacterium]
MALALDPFAPARQPIHMLTARIEPQKLLQSLPKSRDRAIGLRHLMTALNVAEEQGSTLLDFLTEFARSGLAHAKSGKYWRKQTQSLLIGKLTGTRSGHAFVMPDDERERKAGDLYVNEFGRGSAMHGDTVIARVTGMGGRGRSASIEAVLVRANTAVVGRLVRLKSECMVVPLEERFLYEISIGPADTLGAPDGYIVSVEITRPPIAGRPPLGKVVEVLGAEDAPGMDLEIIIRKHRLRHSFSGSVLDAAAAIPEQIPEDEITRRLDLRLQSTVTIDGETARDFDDAVSLELLDNGRYRLGVHIADVSFYVREGTALDEEAFRRGTSVYFPERAIPMLPARLSNMICSLNPKVDRLTISAIIELDRAGKVVDYELAPSVIRSSERMTYTAVNQILTQPDGETASTYRHIEDMLVRMHELAIVLIQRREDRGAIDFDIPEAEIIFNDEGQIGGIVRAERNIAHRIIEEFMLLANETVAKHLEQLQVPAVYRIHDEPDPGKVEEFQEVAESFGHKFSMHGPIPQRGFQHLLREVAGKTEERMISYLMLRSMERARYSPQNEGHFGLAMKTYTHFTSPIRRYPDLIVHRILREVLKQGADANPDLKSRGRRASVMMDIGRRRVLKKIDWPVLDEDREMELRQSLDAIATHSSERERAADDAERELMTWRKAEFMAARVGEEFRGIITSIKEYGFYVELDEYFVEGLVHVSTINDDVYEYDRRKHRLVGVRKGRMFHLGAQIQVLVDRVDMVRHMIDFSVSV